MRVNKVIRDYNKYKILLLDDDAKYVDKKIEVLKSYGYNVDGETVVSAALSMLKEKKYDLLILDYLMDEMRGDKVVEEIRKFNKDLYILLLTGYAEAPALNIMDNLDITAYCEKSNDNTQLLILIKSALKSVEMVKKVKKSKDGLSSLLKAAPKLYKMQGISFLLNDIISEISLFMRFSDAFVMIDNVIEIDNFHANNSVFKGAGSFKYGIKTVNSNLMSQINDARIGKEVKAIKDGIIMPIVSDRFGDIGIIFVKNIDKVDGESLNLLKMFATIAASSITNALLQNMIEIKNEQLQSTKEEVDTWYLSTVNTIRLAIDAKDHYTGGHSDRVSAYAASIGKAFNLPHSEIDILRDSGIFHDLGKIGTNDSILKKKGNMTDEEFLEIKKHPQRGALILSAVSMFNDLVPIVLYHHERYDGKGYPKGLMGSEIPFLARILCVADSLDAMTTDRPYRERKTVAEAIEELKAGAGSQFDPEIVKTTVDLILNGKIIIEQ